MQKRYVRLSKDEVSFLEHLKKTSSSERERNRAHALLLSNLGYDIPNLSIIFGVNRTTISEWFNRWETDGIVGLSDAARSGRPRTFSESEEKK